jgi:large subunit ribosomal protein L2
MGLRTPNPTSAGQRGRIAPDFADLTKGARPLKALTEAKPATGGRNVYGRITSRFRGGGHKRRFRLIDFKRNKVGVPAKVHSIEYDPNRTARIALLYYVDGDKRYILSPVGLNVGDTVVSSRNADIKPGNSLPLRFIPLGTMVHNLELKINGGAQLVRSAGVGAQVMAKEGDWGQIRLPSGEVRKLHLDCRATIRPGQQRRTQRRPRRQGRAHPLEGSTPPQPRRHHEPHRPPDGRRRGPVLRWPPPLQPLGSAGQGPEDPENKRTDKMIVKRRGQKV